MEPRHEVGKEAMERLRLKKENDKKMKKIILGSAILVAAVIAVFALTDVRSAFANDKKKKSDGKESLALSSEAVKITGEGTVKVTKRWDMPSELTEISGLSHIEGDRFACVQDELGTLFVYNTGFSSIEKTIPFGPAGDYEGLAVVNDAVWVVRSDGQLYELTNINSNKPDVKEVKTSLTAKDNIEGLCFDKANNRLLLAAKDGPKDAKQVYGFDLASRKLLDKPVYSIDMNNEIFDSGKKKGGDMSPSGIAINPVTNDIYITDGPKGKLLVLSNSGDIKKFYTLGKEFTQPEGLIFKPSGELFISNEGAKAKGSIMSVEITD